MADNKKYYYMRLKENYFDSDEQKVLEAMPDGYLYSNILLKLYLKSLKRNGLLMFTDRIPYNAQMIAAATQHQVGTVEKALEIFRELGIIEVLDNGAIYMADVQNFVGQTSTEADRVRDYRLKINAAKALVNGECTNVQQTYNKRTPEIRDKSIELKDKSLEHRDKTTATTSGGGGGEPDRPNLNTIEAYASGNLQYLSPGNMEELVDFMNELPDEVIRYAIDIACANGVRKWGYVRSILQAWVEAGVKTLGAAKAETEKKPQSKAQNKPAAQDYQQHQYTDEDFKWNDLERLYGGG